VKQGGTIVNLTSRGNHADTFDSGKLAEEILSGGVGRLEIGSADMGDVATRRVPAQEDAGLIGRPMDETEPGDFTT
jgi:hypothetical protein